jgi:ketosteroid isomerase-like protein
MSQENVERLTAMYEAFSRADFDAVVEIAHPEVEFIRPGQGTIRGREALRAWVEPDALEAHKVEPLDFRISGRNVLVRQHHRARGAESGIEVEAVSWAVWTFDDDGLVSRAEGFLVEDEALEALGPRE